MTTFVSQFKVAAFLTLLLDISVCAYQGRFLASAGEDSTTGEMIPQPLMEDNSPRTLWAPEWALRKLSVQWRASSLRLRREVRQETRPNVIWVHLHKNAGSWVCRAAKRQGEVLGPDNCNWPGDGCWGVEGKTNVSEYMRPHKARCAEREASSTITFSMIERPLEAGDLACKDALLGIMVRKPISAVMSMVAYEGLDHSILTQMLDFTLSKEVSLQQVQDQPVKGILRRQLDNFAVRSLSGNFWADVGELTELDLNNAIAALKRLDIIIPLEQLEEHVIQLEEHLGWKREMIQVSRAVNRLNATDDFYRRGDLDWLVKKIEEVNHLDRRLYDVACELARNRTDALKRG